MPSIVGFDPGGKKNFGWCICLDNDHLPLVIHRTGVTNHAPAAVGAAIAALPQNNQIVGVGIDAPMFWRRDFDHNDPTKYDREVDQMVRLRMQNIGRARPGIVGGVVQNVNCLQGACLVQGIITGILLRNDYPAVPITESHPKALLWILGLGDNQQGDGVLTPNPALIQFLGQAQFNSEHERDAALGALGAWAMIHHPAGWDDLFPYEQNPILPVPGPMSYWMPNQAI